MWRNDRKNKYLPVKNVSSKKYGTWSDKQWFDVPHTDTLMLVSDTNCRVDLLSSQSWMLRSNV